MNRPDANLQEFVRTWGFIPARIFNNPSPGNLPTIFTSMFLHGSLLHLISNMLFLWVFGDNIEDELGHVNFLLFYCTAGAVGSLSQLAINPASSIPMIGASGAISGVLAAYLLLFPQARVLTAVILIFFIRLVYLPAWILLGFWVFIQLIEAFASLGMPHEAVNVAWFAHIGGFVSGLVLSVLILTKKASGR
ncbi:MAG: rhomboid family intramembrane serine protease [bacterium]